MEKYYVYHHKTLEGRIFYVGKGTRRRAWARYSRNRFWVNVVRKHGLVVEIIKDNISQEAARKLEILEIKKLRDLGVELCNITDGGDGSLGVKPKNRKPVFSSCGMFFESGMDAEKWLIENGYPLARASNISLCCRGVINYCYGRAWSRVEFPPHPDNTDPMKSFLFASIESCSKRVYSSLGEEFESVSSAAKSMMDLGYKSAISRISSVALGNSRIACGRNWSYDGFPSHPTEICRAETMAKKFGHKVSCSNGMIFDSVRESARWVRDNVTSKCSTYKITRCLNKEIPEAYGHKWEYADE